MKENLTKQPKPKSSQKSPTFDVGLGRIPPHDSEIETAVIGAIMLEKSAFETANSILTADMFYVRANEIIYTACADLDAERKPVDMLTVTEKLKESGTLEAVGGAYYIATVIEKVASTAHLEFHCQIIKEKYLKRRLIEICYANISAGYDETEDANETIAKLSAEIELLQELIVGKRNTSHVSTAARQSIEQMHIRIDNRSKGITPGISTGFADLNALTNGWLPEKFIVVAARPGVGKTSMAIKFARKAALQGTPVAFFSLEMGETELTDRMIIAEAQIDADDYNSGKIRPDEINRAEMSMLNISELPIYIDDNPKVTVGNIVNKARLLKKQGKCGIAIIDYMQLITPNIRQGRTREQEVSEISRLLKIHAKELKIPFIVLCQMNRDIEAEKREPRLSDLRESGSIEQDADIVIFISRPGMYVEELRDKKTGERLENYIELLIKKHRGGKTGKVRVKHNASMTEFYDWEYQNQTLDSQPVKREISNFYEREIDYDTPF